MSPEAEDDVIVTCEFSQPEKIQEVGIDQIMNLRKSRAFNGVKLIASVVVVEWVGWG